MGPEVQYLVKACFATSHTQRTLTCAGDAVTLVCDDERRLTVVLRACSSEAEESDVDAIRVSHAAPCTANEDHADRLVLVALPWQSNTLALRVNDVLYDCGDYPVVLAAGDVVRLCRPGMTDDDNAFVVLTDVRHMDGVRRDGDDDVAREHALWRTYYTFRYGSCDDVCTLSACRGRLTVSLDETIGHDVRLQRGDVLSDAYGCRLAELPAQTATRLPSLSVQRSALRDTATVSPWTVFVAHRKSTYI